MPAPVVSKLKFSSADSVLLIDLPAELTPLFRDVWFEEAPVGSTSSYTAVLIFASSQPALQQAAPKVLASIQSGAKFWVAYPKKSSSIKTDINRDQGWEVLVEAGYGAVAAISINDTWSALRFKPEAEVSRQGAYRTNQPVRRSSDNVLLIPDYLQEHLEKHPDEKAFFDSLAYTHRKEYVNWITEAKKPETRERRLAQMLQMLSDKKKSR